MNARAWLVAALAAGCSQTTGLDETVTPLVRIRVATSGDAPAAPLHAALVWGRQWLPEPFCILPPESDEAAAVIAAGCRDPFGFVPLRVGADVAIEPGHASTLDLVDLPAADVMVGDITARVGYASVVVYEDRNDDGTLDVRCAFERDGDEGGGCGHHHHHDEEGGGEAPGEPDVVHGASFVSMTRPDRRVALREGDFDATAAFYPRAGCPAPPKGFSVVGAGGFTPAAAFASLLKGMLPPEDPSTCTEESIDAATITVPLAAGDDLRDLACAGIGGDGLTRYAEPPPDPPDAARAWACAGLPDLGALAEGNAPAGDHADVRQVVIAGPPGDPCKTLTHWVLRGCDDDPFCDHPHWDFSKDPPSWWPCPVPEAP